MIRVAAMGDIHLGTESRGMLRPSLANIADHADVLLVAGDLTHVGDPTEAEIVAEELAGHDVPVIAVLGNHDHQSDAAEKVTLILEGAGVTMLDGSAIEVDTESGPLGVAGTKGFGGGFPPAMAAGFGEPEMRAFVATSNREADALQDALESLRCETRVALTHYAPVVDTLAGERPEIYAFLGSIALAEAIDEGSASLAIHGHAHLGAASGATPGGVPVMNVAQPVIRAPYTVVGLEDGKVVSLQGPDHG